MRVRFSHLTAYAVVSDDQQVTDDGVMRIVQGRDRDDGREAAAVLADIGQLADIFNSAFGFEHQSLEAGSDWRAKFVAQRLLLIDSLSTWSKKPEHVWLSADQTGSEIEQNANGGQAGIAVQTGIVEFVFIPT
ncbi:MAG: hypothetical protein WAW02_08010 [Sideroxyarcus sp.]